MSIKACPNCGIKHLVVFVAENANNKLIIDRRADDAVHHQVCGASGLYNLK